MKLFTGKFCMPCKMLKTWLDQNNIEVEEVLAEEHMDEVEKFNIKQTPSLVLDDSTVIAGKDNIVEYFEDNTNE